MHYKIIQSADLKVIGKSIQVEKGIFPVELDTDPKSTKNFWFERADLDKLMFPEPIVHPKAILTDYIPCSIMGNRSMPIVSDKIKEIINKSRHNNPQFIPIKVHHRKKIEDGYYFLNAYDFKYQCIDIERTTIKWDYGYSNRQKNTQILISSYNELIETLNLLKPPVGISINPLFLNELADGFDFFSLSWVKGGLGYYVSESLKAVFEKEGVTGIDFFDVNAVI